MQFSAENLKIYVTSLMDDPLLSFQDWLDDSSQLYFDDQFCGSWKREARFRLPTTRHALSVLSSQIAGCHADNKKVCHFLTTHFFKLRGSNRFRLPNWLISWWNRLLINIFDPNLKLDFKLLWQNRLKGVQNILKSSESKIEIDQKWLKMLK